MSSSRQSLWAFRNLIRFMILCLVVPVLASLAAAQTGTGTISGKVVDPTGAVIPGASVVIESEAIAVRRTTVSNADGFFVVPNLPVAIYRVTVEAPSFTPFRADAVKLDVGGALSITAAMKVGASTESIEVTGIVQTVNTENANTEMLVQGTQVTEIALNGRNWAQLINLAPGTSQINSDTQQGTNVRIDDTAINGLRRRSNPTIDGANNVVHGSVGSMINNVSVDAIQEFKLVSSPYSAEYGGQAGPAITVVTKRGTNAFHGSAFEFFRHDALNAYSWASGKADNPQKPHLRFNNFGGFVGGPIYKNKLFFFGGTEFKLPRTGSTINAVVPTMAMRNGDFSAFLPAGLPATQTSCTAPAGVVIDATHFLICDKSANTTGTWFRGNIIPLNKMSPNGRALLAMYPEPNSGLDRWVGSPVNKRDVRNDLARIDYQQSERSSFFFRWMRDTFKADSPAGNQFDNQTFPIAPDHHNRVGDTYYGSWTRILSTSMLNEMSLMYQTNNQDINYVDLESISRDAYGVNFVELFPENRLDKIPEINLRGYSLVTGGGLPYDIRNTNWEFRDTFSTQIGNHSLKTGVYYGHTFNSENFRSRDGGTITFTTGSDADTNFRQQDAGNAVANMLLGAFSRYAEVSRSTEAPSNFNQLELFINDQWRIHPRLTLTLGLRWQYIPWPTTEQNNIVGFDPTRFDPSKAPLTTITNGTVTSDISRTGVINLIPDYTGTHTRAEGYYDPYNGLVLPGCAPDGADPTLARLYDCGPSGLSKSYKNGWAPRFGFAWDPWGDGKTAIRGGAGIFYDRTLLNVVRQASQNAPFATNVTLTNGKQYTTPATVAPTFFKTLDNVGPLPTNVGFMQTLNVFSPEMKPGVAYTWSLSLQRELMSKLFLDISYVGNQGRHWTHQRDINYVLESLALARRADGTFVNPTTDLARQFPGWGAMTSQENSGNSNYNSLQVSVQRRMSRGFTMSGSYTWGKALSTFDVETTSQRVPFDQSYDYGYANFDRRHSFASSWVYELPFLKAQKGVTGHAFGGWQISGTMSWATGLHQGISGGSRNSAAPSIGYGNFDVVGDYRAVDGGQNPNAWVSRAAFVGRTGQIGNYYRNFIEMPNTQTWNLSFMKKTKIRENVDVQFRGEIFNLLNHPNFNTLSNNLNSSDFGQLTQTDDPRVLQFGLKLMF